MLSDQNRLGEAERTLETAIALEPDDAAGYYRLGVVRHQIAKYDGAAEALERAVALSPDNTEYWYQLARALEETGTGHAEAGAAHLRAAELNGHDVDVMWSAINWHVEANEFETAESLVRTLLERQGEDNPDPLPQFTLGVILKSAGRIDEARAAFEAALEGCDRVPRVTDKAAFALAAYKARIYYAMDDHDGARRAFRAIGQMIAPAAFEFSPAQYLARMLPRVEHMRSIVRGRDVALLCHGTSIATLEDHIAALEERDICYVSVNRFAVMEHYILSKIGRRLDIVASTNPQEFADYLDHITEFLGRPEDNLLITCRPASSLLPDSAGFEHQFDAKLLYFSMLENLLATPLDPLNFLSGNTLSMLVPLLQLGHPRRIVLFGADGVAPDDGAPTHYRRSSPEFGGTRALTDEAWRGRLAHDTRRFNGICELQVMCLCGLFGVDEVPVFNASPHSGYRTFPRITVDDAVAMLRA